MIALRELRDGNWILPDNKKKFNVDYNLRPIKCDLDIRYYGETSVRELYTNTKDGGEKVGEIEYLDNYRAIEIKPEHIEKCGFIISTKGIWNAHKDLKIFITFDITGICLLKINGAKFSVKYIHRLQNLVFELTDKELEVSL